MKLRFERGALADLNDIFAYIAKDNPGAAAQLVARIEQVTRLIAEQPHLGVATRNPKFRRFPVGGYLIMYEVGSNEVIVQFDMARGCGRGRANEATEVWRHAVTAIPHPHPSRYQLASCHRSLSQPEICAVSLPPRAAARVRERMGWM